MNSSVPDAVWLAALLTYEKFKTGTVESLSDVAFKQAVIQKSVGNGDRRRLSIII